MARFVFWETPPSLVAQAAPLYAELTAIQMQLALLKLALKYRPDQPRVPAGNPDGGRWTNAAWVRVAENDGPGAVATDTVNPKSLLPAHIPYSADIDRNIPEAEMHSPSPSDLDSYPTMCYPPRCGFAIRSTMEVHGTTSFRARNLRTSAISTMVPPERRLDFRKIPFFGWPE